MGQLGYLGTDGSVPDRPADPRRARVRRPGPRAVDRRAGERPAGPRDVGLGGCRHGHAGRAGVVHERPAPDDGSEWGARVIILAALLVPPALLLLFVAGLRDLQHLPERTRLPADVRTRARDLRDRARKVSQPKGVLGAISSACSCSGREVLTSRDALSPFGVVAIVLRPAMLLAALFAALAAVLKIPAALVFLVILAVT